MIKKVLFISTILLLFFTTKVLAKTGDVIGHIYSTDILAFINGVPVDSYNIGGKTVIIIEDLSDYGVTFTYSNELRTLVAYMTMWDNTLQKHVRRGSAGKIAGNIYETDIKTYVNGLPIQSYSLNGKIAVAIEDLCLITNESMEYSPYNMRSVWNSTERTISLYFLYDNSSEIYSILKERQLSLVIYNDTISIEANHFYTFFGGQRSADFNPPPSSFPIYCGTQRVGTGCSYIAISINQSENGQFELDESRRARCSYYNIEAIKAIVDTLNVPSPNYVDILKYYTEEMFGTVLDRIDTDYCTFLYISQGTPHGASEFLVWINKDGRYKDFSKDFESASFWGTKIFTNVKIENEQVSFSYDEEYVIDLKSGDMYKK